MATYRLPILDWATVPDSSGNVFFEPYSVKATNDVWLRLVAVFNNTASARMGLHGGFTVPNNYVGTAKVIVVWTSTATSGNNVWDFDYRVVSGDDTTSFDQSGTQESVSVTDAAPGAAHRRLEASVNLTSGNFSANANVEFALYRDKSDAADTMAAAAMLFELYFEYADA